MNEFSREFVSKEPRTFKFKLGGTLASALAGFVAGVVLTSIIWMTAIYALRAVGGM